MSSMSDLLNLSLLVNKIPTVQLGKLVLYDVQSNGYFLSHPLQTLRDGYESIHAASCQVGSEGSQQ